MAEKNFIYFKETTIPNKRKNPDYMDNIYSDKPTNMIKEAKIRTFQPRSELRYFGLHDDGFGGKAGFLPLGWPLEAQSLKKKGARER